VVYITLQVNLKILYENTELILTFQQPFSAKDGDQKQWTTLSWWPRPNVFDKSGMWTGYWNSSCEIWFQQRLDSIHCGEAKPLKAKEWKSALRYHQKKTRQLCDLTEEASARFIGKVLG